MYSGQNIPCGRPVSLRIWLDKSEYNRRVRTLIFILFQLLPDGWMQTGLRIWFCMDLDILVGFEKLESGFIHSPIRIQSLFWMNGSATLTQDHGTKVKLPKEKIKQIFSTLEDLEIFKNVD